METFSAHQSNWLSSSDYLSHTHAQRALQAFPRGQRMVYEKSHHICLDGVEKEDGYFGAGVVERQRSTKDRIQTDPGI